MKRILRKVGNRLLSLRESLNDIPSASGDGIPREKLKELVGKPNPVILEIGCNDGFHTLWFLEDFEQAEIHCFEPDPRALKRFKAKIGNKDQITLHEIALSSKNEIMTFHQSSGMPNAPVILNEGWDLSGSLLEPHRHK